MKIDTNIIIASSRIPGFKNTNPGVPFSVVFGGGLLATGAFVGAIRASTPLDNADQISEVQAQLSGLESFTREVEGSIVLNVPNNAAPTYQIEIMSYFTGGALIVDTYISNQTGGTITLPAITFNFTAFLFKAPF